MGVVISFDELQMFKDDYCLLSDFFDFFCGKHIGSGESREVYEFRLDEKYVIKIDKMFEPGGNNFTFSNVAEWEFYHNVKHHSPKIAEYLAPIMNISKCGKVMMMQKTTPIPNKKVLPKKLPALFTDTKIENWGMIGNKVVCHDYANHRAYAIGSNASLVDAKWWSSNNQRFFQ